MSRKYKGTPGLPDWWAWAVLLVLVLAAAIALIQRLFY